MPRNVRNSVVLAKIEAPYGQDAAPTGSLNAILCSSPKITPLQSNNVDRDLTRAYFGASEQLVGSRYVKCELVVELAGSGTAGTVPAFGPLLRACAFAQVIIAATRVDYVPITNVQESVSIYYFDDGVLHKLLGARGNVKFDLMAGNRPTATFEFSGLDGAISAAGPGTVDYSAFRTPLVVVDVNSGDVVFGGTVAATGAPAIAGGTAYTSLGLDLDMGNQVEFSPLLGGETVDVTNRGLSGNIKLDLDAATEVTFRADVLAATLRAMSLQHGTVAGNKLIVHQPTVQLYDWAKEELNGRRLIGFKTRGVPTPGGSGNDELRLVFF